MRRRRPPARQEPARPGPAEPEARRTTPPAGSTQWMEAYRMRLAGADRGEVARYLERRGVGDAERMAEEVFRTGSER